jgi:hypothetical protein
MRIWLYDMLVEFFAGINIVTEDRGPEWRYLWWRPASSMAEVRQRVTYHFRAVT